jgi:hypothetical protein
MTGVKTGCFSDPQKRALFHPDPNCSLDTIQAFYSEQPYFCKTFFENWFETVKDGIESSNLFHFSIWIPNLPYWNLVKSIPITSLNFFILKR